jgi:hypothetical protein
MFVQNLLATTLLLFHQIQLLIIACWREKLHTMRSMRPLLIQMLRLLRLGYRDRKPACLVMLLTLGCKEDQILVNFVSRSEEHRYSFARF